MGNAVKVGEIVPLSVKVECYDGPLLYVRATIYDKDNQLLATRNLSLRNTNKYEDFTYLMPDEPLISVDYMAYTDSNYSTPLEDWCEGASEVFVRFETEKSQVEDLVSDFIAANQLAEFAINIEDNEESFDVSFFEDEENLSLQIEDTQESEFTLAISEADEEISLSLEEEQEIEINISLAEV